MTVDVTKNGIKSEFRWKSYFVYREWHHGNNMCDFHPGKPTAIEARLPPLESLCAKQYG